MLQHKNNTRIIVRIKDRVYINDAGACIYLHIAQSIFTMEVGQYAKNGKNYTNVYMG